MSTKNPQVTDPYSDEAQMNARTVSQWYDRVVDGVEKCPFCDLREKYFVLELKKMVLTMNTYPYIDGHLLIIPKRHIEKFTQLDSQEWKETKTLIEVGMKVLREVLKIEDINVLYREGIKAGTSLKHLHAHILPINSDFLQYKKTHFVWEFQKITMPPREMAIKLKNAL